MLLKTTERLMMPKTLFRRTRPNDAPAADREAAAPMGDQSPEHLFRIYQGQLEHLKKQKDLHALALKEMYQFMCKIETTYREENQKLQDQLREQQERSARLIEVTTGLWEIIEMLDGYQEASSRMKELNKEVKELAQMDMQGDGANIAPDTGLEFNQITDLIDAVEQAEAA